MDKEQRIANAIDASPGCTDPIAIWRDHIAPHQVSSDMFRRLAELVDQMPTDVVMSIMETRGQTAEARFNAAQPDYIAPEEVAMSLHWQRTQHMQQDSPLPVPPVDDTEEVDEDENE